MKTPHTSTLVSLAGSTLLAAALSSCGGGDAGTEGAVERPNVILITLDTVRADYLSCYGSPFGSTPVLDGIASDGAVFERAVSSSGLTPASHATILTGKFQYNHGVRVLAADSGFYLDSDHATLATKFKEAGYRTGAVHSAFPVSRTFGFDRGFDHFDSFETDMEVSEERGKAVWDVKKFQRRSDETTDRTLAWLEEATADDTPFFLWIHYWDPHDPVMLPPDADLAAIESSPELSDIQDELTRKYGAEVRWQDGQIGRLIEGLRAMGVYDDTVMAVTADHGQGLRDGMRIHRWGMHRMLYREQVHVPFLLKAPGVPAGSRVMDQVRTADLAPTVLAAAGMPPIEGRIDGESLLPRIAGKKSGDLVAYGEQINGYDFNAAMRKNRPDASFLYMVSDGDWKLIYKPHMPHTSELYHVGVDPLERANVRESHPDQMVRLLGDLAARNPWVVEEFPKGRSAAGVSEAVGGLGYAGIPKGQGDWWWTCPEHDDYRADERGRHDVDGCGRILIPRGTWKDAGRADSTSPR